MRPRLPQMRGKLPKHGKLESLILATLSHRQNAGLKQRFEHQEYPGIVCLMRCKVTSNTAFEP